MVRLFNAEGDNTPQKVTFTMPLSDVEEVDLNGKCIEKKKISTRNRKSGINVSMPRFGVKTFFLNIN